METPLLKRMNIIHDLHPNQVHKVVEYTSHDETQQSRVLTGNICSALRRYAWRASSRSFYYVE